jgi:hypothetical protein
MTAYLKITLFATLAEFSLPGGGNTAGKGHNSAENPPKQNF